MKLFNKLIVVMIVAVFMFGSCISAFAAGTDSITITINPPAGTTDTGETYQAYKIFDLVKSDGTNAHNDNTEKKGFAYTITGSSPWFSVVQGLKNAQNRPYFELTQAADGTSYSVKLAEGMTLSEATAKEIAAALLAAKPNAATAETVQSGTAKSVDPGYYLISSSLGANLILASTDVTINEKNDYPSVTKQVKSSDEVAQIGQDVEFTITVTVPESANKQIVLTDTMSQGLTFKQVSSVKNSDNQNVTNTVSNIDTSTNSFTITFADSVVAANAGKTITVTYLCTVNNNALVSALNDSDVEHGGDKDDNTNEVRIQYSNFSQSAKVDVNTLSFQLNKYDGSEEIAPGGEPTPIAGAKFQLLDANKTVMKLYKVSNTEFRIPTAAEITANTNIVEDFTTVAGTKLTFKGLDSDLTYYLREIEAPKGFNKLDTDSEVRPATDLSLVTRVANNKGSEMPSTGGIGTTLFYMVGAALVIGAGLVLIVKKRLEYAE